MTRIPAELPAPPPREPYRDGFACLASLPGALGWRCLYCGRSAGTYQDPEAIR